MRETIVDAAVLYKGKVYPAKRHYLSMEAVWSEDPAAYVSQEMQGFVTNEGKFVSREDASWIAFRSGQTKTRKERLLSEHLWPEICD